MTLKELKDLCLNNMKLVMTIVIAVFIVLIIILLSLSGHRSVAPNNEETTVSSEIRDYVDLGSVVKEANSGRSEIQIISIDNSEQAKIILSLFGLEISDVANYGLCVNPSVNKSYAIAVIQPKEDTYDKCKLAFISYLGDKQEVLITLNKSEPTEPNKKALEIAEDALIYERSGYIMLVMTEDNENIIDYIKSQIDESTKEVGEYTDGQY